MATLTLCMIVRDEEEMLPHCLASARHAVDRMVVVDTGSRDGTLDVIRRFGAELVEHEWREDFAAARNAGLERVESGYVLILDADERLTARAVRVLRATVRRGVVDLGLLPLHDAASLDAPPRQVISGEARRGEPIQLPRLLRRTSDLRFEGIVHESVAAWAAAGRRTEALDAPIVHYGAAPELRAARGKDERNRLLLEKRCALEPDNPTPHAYLAAELRRAGEVRDALVVARQAWALWQASSSRGEGHDAVLPASLLGQLAIQDGQLDEAAVVVAEALASGEHPNLHLLAGLVEEHRVVLQGGGAPALERAFLHYQRCLALDGRPFPSEVMAGATSWQAALRLGTVLLQSGEPLRARQAFEHALGTRRDLREACLGLAEAILEGGGPDEALGQLEPLLSEPGPDAWLLSARAALELGSVPDARLLLDRARAERDTQAFLAPHRDRSMTTLERDVLRSESVPAVARQPVETCVFAWPSWSEREDLDALLGGFGKLLADRPDLVLCLRHDPRVDGGIDRAQQDLERAFREHLGAGRDLHVVLMDQELEGEQAVAALAAPRDIALGLPNTHSERRRFLDHLGVRRVDDPAALQRALSGIA